MHKIKVHGPEKDWGSIREAIFLAAFCILLALASFEAGWIIRDFLSEPEALLSRRQKDETQRRVLKLETKFTDHDGRITVLEGPSGRKK